MDRRTASAAELFAGCLQANGRAVVVGETTYGKGVAIAVVPGDGGGCARYAAVAACTLAGDRVVQGQGVAPDVAIEPEGDGSEDRALAAALQIAQKSLS